MPCSPEDLNALMRMSRNGCNQYFLHSLNNRFVYTDGVRDMAQLAGAYWLLDILASEVAPVYQKNWQDGRVSIAPFTVDVQVQGSRKTAVLKLTPGNDEDPLWTRTIDYTDFPQGTWELYLGADEAPQGGYLTTCILPSEY